MKLVSLKMFKKMAIAAAALTLFSCTNGQSGNGGGMVYYPYETVYGDVCSRVTEPTPGCTFFRNGGRVTVSSDPYYNNMGGGSNDMWYVAFDRYGRASVYNEYGQFQYHANVAEFAGFITGTTIGVGNTGSYWENVAGKTYWFGKNGVLYSANPGHSNYGKAINNKDASKATDVNSKAINSDKNRRLIQAGAEKLKQQYGLSSSKAIAVASALNSWAVMGAERGKVTETDMDKTFKTVFGVKFNETLAAFKDYQNGNKQSARELTNRSATALGLKPDQAQDFIKGMYKGAIEKMGYNVNDISW